MNNRKRTSAFIKSIKKIKLVDRCLILFMTVLMVQSIYNLFFNETNSQESHSIDIVIRTTSAGIFGYFLSANFIKTSKDKSGESEHSSSANAISTKNNQQTTDTKNSIGFTSFNSISSNMSTATEKTTDSGQEILKPPPNISIDTNRNINSETETEQRSEQQLIIATIIGITSLMVMIISRNSIALTPATIGTLSQMRDFVSGCVGFLLGSPNTTE